MMTLATCQPSPTLTTRSLQNSALGCRPSLVRAVVRHTVVRAGFYGSKNKGNDSAPKPGRTHPNWVDKADKDTLPPQVNNLKEAGETTIDAKTAGAIRNLSLISFWVQVSLSVVSSVILFFSIQSGGAPGQAPNVSTWFTLVGCIFSFVSTFLAQGFRRTARAVLESGDNIATGKLVSGLLRAVTLNLWGLGATVIGLQATVGTLVAKTLTSSSQNPYQAGQIARSAAAGTPAALDAFSIQASTNTVLAHFASIVFANMMMRLLNKSAAQQTKTA